MRMIFLVFLFRVTMKPTLDNKKPVEEHKTLEYRYLITYCRTWLTFFLFYLCKIKSLDSRLCTPRETEADGIYRMEWWRKHPWNGFCKECHWWWFSLHDNNNWYLMGMVVWKVYVRVNMQFCFILNLFPTKMGRIVVGYKLNF